MRKGRFTEAQMVAVLREADRTSVAEAAPVIDAMKTLSARYPRYGYRRIRIYLRRQGMKRSWARAYCIWLA